MENLFFELDFNSNNAEQKVAILKAEIDKLAMSFKTANSNSLKLQESQNKLTQLSEKYPDVANLIVDSVHNISSEISGLQDKQRKLNLTIDTEIHKFFELDAEIKKAENSLKLFGNANETTNLKAKKLKETITVLEEKLAEVNTDTDEGQDSFLRLSEQIDVATKSYKSFTDKTVIAQNATKRLTNEIKELEKAQKRVGKSSSQGQIIETKLQQRRASLQTAQSQGNIASTSNGASGANLLQNIPQLLQGGVGNILPQLRSMIPAANGAAGAAGAFSGALSKLGIAGAVAAGIGLVVSQVVDLITPLTKVSGEFEKFETTLKTALGTSFRADSALKQIQEFAKTTPYEVADLTENFVKLANRGLVPTTKQLTGIGDVASALGKPFGQVVEAILDVNNTERWNELGIKVETVGDKIKGTFKGQTIEMRKSVQGAADLVVAFGNMKSIQGGMAAQSQTLEGLQSNYNDATNQLSKTMGDVFLPVAKAYNSILTSIVNGTNSAVIASIKFFKLGDDLKQTEINFGKSIAGKTPKELESRLEIVNKKLEAANKIKDADQIKVDKMRKWAEDNPFAISTPKELQGAKNSLIDRKNLNIEINTLLMQQKALLGELDVATTPIRKNLAEKLLMNEVVNKQILAGVKLQTDEWLYYYSKTKDVTLESLKFISEYFETNRENAQKLQESAVLLQPEGVAKIRASQTSELAQIKLQFEKERIAFLDKAIAAGKLTKTEVTEMKLPAEVKKEFDLINKTESNRLAAIRINTKRELDEIARAYAEFLFNINIELSQSIIDTEKLSGNVANDKIIAEQKLIDLRKSKFELDKAIYAAEMENLKATGKRDLTDTQRTEITSKFKQKDKATELKAAIDLQTYLNELSAKDREVSIAIIDDMIKKENELLNNETIGLDDRIAKLEYIKNLEILILEERKKQIQLESLTITDPQQREKKLAEINAINLQIADKNKNSLGKNEVSAIDTELGKNSRAIGLQEQELQLAEQSRLKEFFRFNDLAAERAYQNKLNEIKKEGLRRDIDLLEQKVRTNAELYGKDSKQAQDTQKELNAKNLELGQIEIDKTKQRREDWNSVITQSYDIGKQAARDYFAAVIQGYDNDIRKQENRVERAARIAERGNAELLEREQTRLDKLKEERENYVKAQQVLDLIEFGSKSVVAIANAAAAPFPLNLVAIPLTIATLVAGIAQVSALKGNVSAFAEGTDSVSEGNNSSAVLDFFKPKDKNDKVLSLLSPKEAVIQSDIASANPKTIKALRRGLLTDRHLENMNNVNYLPYQVPYIINMQSQETNNLLREMSASIQNMQSQINVVTHQVNITKEGIHKATIDEQSKLNRISKLR